MARKGERVYNVMLDDEEFFRIRNEEVLPQWKTGKQIENFEETVESSREYHAICNYADMQYAAREHGHHNLQPQFGQATKELMIEGMGYVESESPLMPHGVWNIFTDSYTRKCNFEMSEVGLRRTLESKDGKTMLNGFPIVAYGLEAPREIRKALKAGITMNSTDEDGRLSSEFALASGWNACNCRPLQEVFSHDKNQPLEDEIRIVQYEARLAAKYQEAGIHTAPHVTCNLTGYDSPGLKALVMIFQTFIGAAQGVKQFTYELGQNMHFAEDAATMDVTEALSLEYREKLGLPTDIRCSSTSFPYLGAWPPSLDEAEAMICWNTISSIYSGINTPILKCRDEAVGTPTKEGMANAVRMARHLELMLGNLRIDKTGEQYKMEREILELEVRTILDRCLDIADGDVVQAMIKGVEAGWIDTMLTPWQPAKQKVRLMRDDEQAQRYWDPGDLPLPQEVIDYHRMKLEGRAKKEGRDLSFDMLVSDLQFASRIAPYGKQLYK
ncbi:MAG: hypothetical protein PUA57_02755 [Eggerthellales bacterium]|nr:hypothetical protein [Eggerthellales bacterium]